LRRCLNAGCSSSTAAGPSVWPLVLPVDVAVDAVVEVVAVVVVLVPTSSSVVDLYVVLVSVVTTAIDRCREVRPEALSRDIVPRWRVASWATDVQ
jgi:hypothetical protein